MKIARKELWLFVTPLLVICFALLISGANNYVVQREKQAQIQPTLNQNGSVMISRQRQPNGSIIEFLHGPKNLKRVLVVTPANWVRKPQGLMNMDYIIPGVVLAFVASALCLLVLITSSFLRRKRNPIR